MRILRGALLLVVLTSVTLPRRGAAQVRPDLDWRTLTTEHFRVHFAPELETLARRTAFNAEVAWEALSNELIPPRGIVDIVVADNVDFSNGYATPYPTNRIVIYARPPVEETALRNHEDWNRLVVTHELTHIFHLDRATGWWGGAQHLFGRAAPFFPNTYSPSWVLEGLAVHYETRFGGGGRLAGTEFPMLARAAALEGALPPLDAVSLGAPRFPGGSVVYLYGSFLMTRGDTARMGRFVEASSRRILPWRMDANSRDAFGITFSRRWDLWRDSVTRAAMGVRPASDDGGTLRTLTTRGYTALHPRFTANDALVYVADDARDMPGLYRLSLDGVRRRLGRRSSVDVNVPLGNGRTLQAEYEYTDPYTIRSFLTRDSGWRHRRFSPDARLSHPDQRTPNGRVVAVQTVPGATNLVVLDSADDWAPHVVAAGSPDRIWSDPRLSHDASRIAAVRWDRGGRMSVVVLDGQGRELQRFAPRGAALTVVSSPAWVPGDTSIVFVSDHEGRSMVYLGDVRSGAYGRLWTTATGLFTPDVSPDGRRLAAVEMRADGYHVVTRAMPGAIALTRPVADTLPDPLAPSPDGAPVDAAARASRYSPWATLGPSWWLPVIAMTDPGTLSYGLMSSAHDVVGRHAWSARVSAEFARQELSADLHYSYAGLGDPVVYLDFSNEWRHGVIRTTGGQFAGYLGQRARRMETNVVFQRPRVRLSSFFLLGGDVEATDFKTYPSGLLGQLGNAALERVTYTRSAHVAAGFSTMQRPQLAVSSSDGIAGSVQQRFRFGAGLQDQQVQETIVSGTLAKSLPFPGFSRHVLALHAAYGITGHEATSALSVGGVSGSSLELLPGVVIGSPSRTFGVRGFDGGTQLGVRAAAGSAEYRAPLLLVGRGVKRLPAFLQKASLTAFADAGAAWCTRFVDQSFICGAGPLQPRTWLGSVGGELNLDGSLQYDAVYRFRIGFAHPVAGLPYARNTGSLYVSLGSMF